MKAKTWKSAKELLDYLNTTYAKIHTTYEDYFWLVAMGDKTLNAKKDTALNAREIFRNDAFLSQQVREYFLKSTETTKVRLGYWKDFFALYQVPEAAKPLKEKINKLETRIESIRSKRKEGYIDPVSGKFIKASINKIRTMIATHDSEQVRRACFDAVQSLATTVLTEYVELVRLRNQYAQVLGYEDFYAYKLAIEEGMKKKDLFPLLDSVYEKTKYGFDSVRALEKKEKPGLRKPWNFSFMFSGSFAKEEDPFFPFEEALTRWGASFNAMGINMKKGAIVLDLLDREGKYNNGFCHWPENVYYINNIRKPGRAQFTCNVVLGVPGQAHQGMVTLFHEGGHAAHLLNEDMADVCIDTEYPPMSTAWAETQSQFLDEVFDSIEWKSRYAKTSNGESYPFEIFERKLRALDAIRPLDAMGYLRVPLFEKMIYEEKNLTTEKVLLFARKITKKCFDFSLDSITILEVPHLYSWETACSYQNYFLAILALTQWRECFYKKYGYIVDNPHVGKEMEKVWKLGASKTFPEFVKLATGTKLSSSAYIKGITRPIKASLKIAKERIETLQKKPHFTKRIDLNTSITMMHGNQKIADNKKGFGAMAETYATWLKTQYKK